MSDTPTTQAPPQPEPENKLTSDQFDEFKEALEVLYLKANISGRLQFFKAWPGAAEHVLGADLIKYDQDGLGEKERKTELEEEAEERRLALLELLETLEEKSVKDGALQVEYVRDVVEGLGRALSLHIYGPQIIDRFLGPGTPTPEEQPATQTEPPAAAPPPAEPVSPTVPPEPQQPGPAQNPQGGVSLDPMDDIKPIDMSPSAAPPQTETPAPPPQPASASPAQAEPPRASPPVEAAALPPQPQAPAQPPAQEPSAPQSPPAADQSAQQPPKAPQKVEGTVAMTFVPSKDKKDKGDDGAGSPPAAE